MRILGHHEETPEFEAEGEIICVIKNFPTLLQICEDGRKHRQMLTEKHEMILKRLEKAHKDFAEEYNKGGESYWKQVTDYCQAMNLLPPDYSPETHDIDIENGAVIIKKRLKSNAIKR